MSTSDWINLLSAVFAGIAVLLPFIFRRIEKQDRLSRVTYLIKLLKARQELNQILQNENQISIDVRNEATNVLERVDIELATPRENDRFGLFVLSAFVESVLFLGAGFTQLSEWYKYLWARLMSPDSFSWRGSSDIRPQEYFYWFFASS